MADGVNYLKMATPTPANRLKPGEYDGRLKVMTDEIALVGETGTFRMCGVIPKGAIVVAVLVSMPAFGQTIDIGDAEVPARYFTAQASGAVINESGNVLAGANYEVDETDADNLDNQIVVTPDGALTGTLKLTVLYAHD